MIKFEVNSSWKAAEENMCIVLQHVLHGLLPRDVAGERRRAAGDGRCWSWAGLCVETTSATPPDLLLDRVCPEYEYGALEETTRLAL